MPPRRRWQRFPMGGKGGWLPTAAVAPDRKTCGAERARLRASIDKAGFDATSGRPPPLSDLQAAWLLLLFCALPRANHLLRMFLPGATADLAGGHDDAVQSCLSSALWADCLPAIRACGDDRLAQGQAAPSFGGLLRKLVAAARATSLLTLTRLRTFFIPSGPQWFPHHHCTRILHALRLHASRHNATDPRLLPEGSAWQDKIATTLGAGRGG